MMNHIFKLSIILLALLCYNTQSTDAKKSNRSANKIYYVVVGSYSTLDNAIQEARTWSGKQPSIYKTTAKGNVYYRLCVTSFSTSSKAKAYIANNGLNGWVWPSTAAANCVWSPGSSSSYTSSINRSSSTTRNKSYNSSESLSWIQGNWKRQMVIYGRVHEIRLGISGDYIAVFIDGQHEYTGPYKIKGNHLLYGRDFGTYVVLDHNAKRLKDTDNGTDYYQRF